MKTKNFSKKLTLNKETIAQLRDEQLDEIRGGKPTNANTCYTCFTNCGASIVEPPCVC